MEKYRYKLKSMCASSERYGNCEVCKKHVSEVFYQTEERYYKFEHNGEIYDGWTQNKCSNLFGHKECLLSEQRNKEAEAI